MDRVEAEISDDGMECNVDFQITRDPFFYLFNIVLINFFIVLISFSVVAIDMTDYSSRLSILITSVLTAVAFKFVTVNWVPNVSYLTRLDKYIIFTFIMLSFVVLESFFVSLVPSRHYDIGRGFDVAIVSVFVVIWIVLHLFIWVGSVKNYFYKPWDVVLQADNHDLQQFEVPLTAIRKNKNKLC